MAGHPRGRLIKKAMLGKDQVEISSHTLDRMKQRRITENQVLEALRNPSETGLNTSAGRHRVRRRLHHGRAIDVVYEIEPDRILVVTAMRTTTATRSPTTKRPK